MSLPDVLPIASYSGNASTSTAYPFPFKVLAASHVKLYIDGVLSTDAITVTGVGDEAGVDVTTSVAYTSEQQVTLRREVPFSQETDLVEGGRLREESLENALDYGVMQAQQLKEELGRAVKFPPGSTGSTLPSSTNSTIGQDANGDLVSRTAQEELDHLGVGASATAAAASAAAAALSETNAGASETIAVASAAAAEASNINASAAVLDLASRSFPTARIGKKFLEPNITSDVVINFPGGGVITLKASERPYTETNAINAVNGDVQYFIGDIINIINGDVTDAETGEDYGLSTGGTNVSNIAPINDWSAELATDGGTNITDQADLTYYGSNQTTLTVPLPLEVKAGATLDPPADLPFVIHTSAQSLTDTQKTQAKENIGLGDVSNSDVPHIAGPYIDFPDAVSNGVKEGELWRDAKQQVFFGAYALADDVVTYFSQFSNSTSTEEKIRISRLLGFLQSSGYGGDVISLQLLRYGQNINTGTTRYGLLGDDFAGLLLDGAPTSSGQLWSTIDRPQLSSSYAGSTTLVVWGEPKDDTVQWGNFTVLYAVTADRSGNTHLTNGSLQLTTRSAGNLSVTTTGTGGPTDEQDLNPVLRAHLQGRSVFIAVRDEASSGDVSVYKEGALHDTLTNSIPTQTQLEFLSFHHSWKYSGAMVINGALSASEVAALTDEIRATVYREPWQILISGDSLSSTANFSANDTTVPSTGETHFMTVAGNDNPQLEYEFLENRARPGLRTDEIDTPLTALLASHPVPSGAENYVFRVMGGSNDVGEDAPNEDPPAYYNILKSMWAEARTAGYKVVACTIPRRASGYGNFASVLEATLELNELIKSDRTLYDALEDVDAAFIRAHGGDDYADNATYYSDQTHPYEAAGQAVLAGTWFAAIDSL